MHQEQQFSQVFKFIPTPSVLILPDAPKYTIVAANNAYLEAVKLEEEDLIGKGIFEAFSANPYEKISNFVTNLTNSLELVVAKKDLHKMPLQKYNISNPGTSKLKAGRFKIQNIPIKDENNNVTHILHSSEDVTEKKNPEIAFQFEKQRLQDLYLQAPSCMGILKGPDHIFEFANSLYLELIDKKDIIGKKLKDVLPELEAQGIFQLLDNVYKTGQTFSANEMLVKFDKGGRGKIVEIYQDFIYQPHKDNNGNIDGIFFFFIDVTEKVESRKKIEESEKRYRELIQKLPVATYSCDSEGHILIYNHAAAVLWGSEPEIGKDKWCGSGKIYSEDGDSLSFDKCPMAIALKKGRIITDQEIIIEQRNGKKVNILPYSVPSMDSTGRITGAVNVLIDISRRKNAELKLKQSQKRLKEAQEIACMGNWDLNFATGIGNWSDEECRIYGLSPSENIQSYENWLSFIHPEDLDEVLSIINESQKTLSDSIINHRIILRDGSIKHVYGKSKFAFDKKGVLEGVYGITIDVTETTKAEEKVKFQSNLLNIITQAAISTNEYGIINFWNNAAVEIYGWTAEEALGKNVISLISTERKEVNTIEIMKELSMGNSSKEFVVRHKDGHTFSVFASISPIYGKHGKYEGTIEVSMDITGRKKEEEKLEKLNKELSDYKYALDKSSIVSITDQKGIITHVNNNFCKISKYSTKELIGQDHRIVNAGHHSNIFIKNLWKTIVSGQVWKGEIKNKAKDGSIYWVDTSITPFLDEHGKPYQYVATRFDITESKKAEKVLQKQNRELDFQNGEKEKRATELISSNKELVKTNKELDRFVYSVSHDLRSPLTSILGLISFIEEDTTKSETLDQVRMIRSSINRLDGFIKNILSYSQNNRIETKKEKIRISTTIREIIDSVRNIQDAKGISFEVDIEEKQPFYSDVKRFNTILENLISNSIKYHTQEVSGRYLKITGTVDPQELILSFTDNGIGIDPEFHEKIFEMFYRLPGPIPGSGFGLYIVKETLEKIHGKIEILSEKGVGTTFILTIKNLKE